MTCCSTESAAGRRARRRARRGLTLLEVMVALLLAAGGFGALMTALSQSARAAERAERARRELDLARTLLEEGFLDALPDSALVPAPKEEKDLVVWRGETRGMSWEATLRSSAMVGLNAGDAGEALGAGADGASAPGLLTMDVVTVRVGSVTLRTVRW